MFVGKSRADSKALGRTRRKIAGGPKQPRTREWGVTSMLRHMKFWLCSSMVDVGGREVEDKRNEGFLIGQSSSELHGSIGEVWHYRSDKKKATMYQMWGWSLALKTFLSCCSCDQPERVTGSEKHRIGLRGEAYGGPEASSRK